GEEPVVDSITISDENGEPITADENGCIPLGRSCMIEVSFSDPATLVEIFYKLKDEDGAAPIAAVEPGEGEKQVSILWDVPVSFCGGVGADIYAGSAHGSHFPDRSLELSACYQPEKGYSRDPEDVAAAQAYWADQPEYCFFVNGPYGDNFPVGLGFYYEWGLHVPFELQDMVEEPAPEAVNCNWGGSQTRFMEGFTVRSLSHFYVTFSEYSFSANWYISCTSDLAWTHRGIRVGDSVVQLKEAYPEGLTEMDDRPLPRRERTAPLYTIHFLFSLRMMIATAPSCFSPPQAP
ncbi:MAG: hypothetical protein Q4C22_08160, partial [Bacillota bacterium]|nr:hypothetical protein [Bacillota bacterium]